jgi:hypothetical protein
MNWLLTALFTGIVAWFLAEGFVRRERMYQFPFLAGVMTFAFILPQLPGAASDKFLPEGDYARMMLVAILCMLSLRLGWSDRAAPFAMFRIAFSERRLLVVAALFSLAGAGFYYKLSHLPGDVSIGVQMSGLPVVYLFFARLLVYGLLIAVLCFVRRPSWAAFMIIMVDVGFYLERILITGKRAEAAELALIVLLPLWFVHRWLIPRWVMALAMVVGTVGMFSMAQYRDITRAEPGLPSLEELSQIDVIGNFNQLLDSGGQEIRNAVTLIATTDRTMELDYGAFHWNRLVFTFVPAQLVGADFKDSLRLPMPGPSRNYNPATGTTETGFVDAFQSFWYFGALKFFLLAYLMARIWSSAMEGQALGQFVYTLSIIPAMHAVSHETDWVMPVWVHMLIFLAPALYFCRVQPGGAPAARTAGAWPAQASTLFAAGYYRS